MSGMEIEDESGSLEINLFPPSVKGRCKAKDFSKQMDKLKEVFE